MSVRGLCRGTSADFYAAAGLDNQHQESRCRRFRGTPLTTYLLGRPFKVRMLGVTKQAGQGSPVDQGSALIFTTGNVAPGPTRILARPSIPCLNLWRDVDDVRPPAAVHRSTCQPASCRSVDHCQKTPHSGHCCRWPMIWARSSIVAPSSKLSPVCGAAFPAGS